MNLLAQWGEDWLRSCHDWMFPDDSLVFSDSFRGAEGAPQTWRQVFCRWEIRKVSSLGSLWLWLSENSWNKVTSPTPQLFMVVVAENLGSVTECFPTAPVGMEVKPILNGSEKSRLNSLQEVRGWGNLWIVGTDFRNITPEVNFPSACGKRDRYGFNGVLDSQYRSVHRDGWPTDLINICRKAQAFEWWQ